MGSQSSKKEETTYPINNSSSCLFFKADPPLPTSTSKSSSFHLNLSFSSPKQRKGGKAPQTPTSNASTNGGTTSFITTSSSSGSSPAIRKREYAMTEEVAHKWLVKAKRKKVKIGGRGNRPRNEARMICIGGVGADANLFKTWYAYQLDIIAVELPARNKRFKEKAMTDVNLIARRVGQAMQVLGYLESTIPVVIFGQSRFGALLGLLLCRVLKKDYAYLPKELIVAACPPLHHWDWSKKYYRESDADMIKSLVETGDLTLEMSRNELHLPMVLPAYKVDYQAMEKFPFYPPQATPTQQEGSSNDRINSNSIQVDVPILVLCGEQDPHCQPLEQLVEWLKYTNFTSSSNNKGSIKKSKNSSDNDKNNSSSSSSRGNSSGGGSNNDSSSNNNYSSGCCGSGTSCNSNSGSSSSSKSSSRGSSGISSSSSNGKSSNGKSSNGNDSSSRGGSSSGSSSDSGNSSSSSSGSSIIDDSCRDRSGRTASEACEVKTFCGRALFWQGREGLLMNFLIERYRLVIDGEEEREGGKRGRDGGGRGV